MGRVFGQVRSILERLLLLLSLQTSDSLGESTRQKCSGDPEHLSLFFYRGLEGTFVSLWRRSGRIICQVLCHNVATQVGNMTNAKGVALRGTDGTGGASN